MPVWSRKGSRSPDLPQDVPGYRLLDVAGRGGFGVVYRARSERLGRQVAVKLLSVDHLDDQTLRRFDRERDLTNRLAGHPNIAAVLDAGLTHSGKPYLVMEYFERGSLKARLEREGPLPLGEVIRIGAKVAAALACAHQAGVLHRDVKPSNILISRYGEPALADFGTGGLLESADTSTRGGAFTAHHVAPEVLEGQPRRQAADIYSLGSTLYQLLAGHPAYEQPGAEGIAPLLASILAGRLPELPAPGVPPAVKEVISRAMARQPEQRFASAGEFAAALQHLQAEFPVSGTASAAAATPVSSPPVYMDGEETVLRRGLEHGPADDTEVPGRTRHRRRRAIAVTAGVAAVVILGTTAATAHLIMHGGAPRPAPRPMAHAAAEPRTTTTPATHRAVTPNRHKASHTVHRRHRSAPVAVRQPTLTAPPHSRTPKPTPRPAPTAVPIPLAQACKWAYPGQATGAISGSGYNIVCLAANGQSLGGFPDGSGHSLNDWCADTSRTDGYSLPQAKLTPSGWVCTVIS